MYVLQDTVVALEALTKYAVMLPRSENGLSVVVTATEMEHTFRIHEHERLLLKRQHLPVLPTQVEVDAVGEGCALVQVSPIHITAFIAIISEDYCLVGCDTVYSGTNILEEPAVSKRQQVPPKCWQQFTRLQNITTQNIVIFIVTAMRR
jgi:hypothetical protein